jgi:hypothetical protein
MLAGKTRSVLLSNFDLSIEALFTQDRPEKNL